MRGTGTWDGRSRNSCRLQDHDRGQGVANGAMTEGIVDQPYHVKVDYRFHFEGGERASFGVDVDLSAEQVIHYSENRYAWTELEFHQCQQCPLSPEAFPHCPAALSIVDIVEYFARTTSFSHCKCEVQFPGGERKACSRHPLFTHGPQDGHIPVSVSVPV